MTRPRPNDRRTGKAQERGKPRGSSAGSTTHPGKKHPGGKLPGGKLPGATDWSRAAGWYDALVGDEGSEYQRAVVFPGVMRLLKPMPGERVLDVACGQGALCRLMRERGCVVTGMDAAGPLIESARKREVGGGEGGTEGRAGGAAVRYHVGDARRLGEVAALGGREFDAATCVLSIQNMDPIGPVFEGVAGLLVSGGRLVVVMMHPCFRGPKFTSWGWDESRGVQYRRVDRYLLPRKEPIVTHPGSDPGSYTWTFHRPMQSYVSALGRAGLLVDALEEWPSHKVSDSGPRAGAENVARRELPMFLALRAVKPSRRRGSESD